MSNAAIDMNAQQAQAKPKPLLDIKLRISRLKRLPPMPEMARRIVQLNSQPNSSERPGRCC